MSNCVVGLRRLRASSRDGSGVVNRPPSPLNMLLSRHTRRRDFITLLGGAATALPLVVRAQQAKIAQIGFLGAATAAGYAKLFEAFKAGLSDLGYLEGKNIVIHSRWAEENYDRLARSEEHTS